MHKNWKFEPLLIGTKHFSSINIFSAAASDKVEMNQVIQSGIVIRFDNHMTSQRGGHCKIREFSHSLRFARHLFEYTRVIYQQLYSISTRKEGALRVLKTVVEDRRKRCEMLLVE